MQNKDNPGVAGSKIKNADLRRKIILGGIAFLGICLIFFSKAISSNDENKECSAEYYSADLEERVEELLLQMEEIESVTVLITLENSGETVYAQNSGSSSADYVLYSTDSGQSGLKIAEIYPQVRGVAVVCNNGNNVSVQNKIISIISSALGISSNRITVSG